MSKDIFLENAMPEREDRLDYWYFIHTMSVMDEPNSAAPVQFEFSKGDVLLVRHYLQNNEGLWGFYDVRTVHKTVRRYILLHNSDGDLAIHKTVRI